MSAQVSLLVFFISLLLAGSVHIIAHIQKDRIGKGWRSSPPRGELRTRRNLFHFANPPHVQIAA